MFSVLFYQRKVATILELHTILDEKDTLRLS